jgi:hypothetical protein
VVDDDEKIVQMVQELMELKGFEVLPATSPEEARRVLDAHPGPIDFLLTDVVMPGTSGDVLSEQVKRRRPEIRVLFMSGFVVVPAHYGFILDSGGQMVTMQRMDGAPLGSIEVARDKAWSAVAFRRPTKAFQDAEGHRVHRRVGRHRAAGRTGGEGRCRRAEVSLRALGATPPSRLTRERVGLELDRQGPEAPQGRRLPPLERRVGEP